MKFQLCKCLYDNFHESTVARLQKSCVKFYFSRRIKLVVEYGIFQAQIAPVERAPSSTNLLGSHCTIRKLVQAAARA